MNWRTKRASESAKSLNTEHNSTFKWREKENRD